MTPPLSTLAVGADKVFRLASDFSAFSCCAVPRIAFMVITANITIVLSTLPETIEIMAAIIRIITKRSANCSANTLSALFFFDS